MTDQPNIDLGIRDPGRHLQQSRRFTIGDLLRKNARVRGTEPAIVGEDDWTLTYRALNNRTDRLANAIHSRGYDRDNTIAIISENRPEYAEVYYAAAKLGIPVGSMNWRLAREELLHCLNVVDADLVFISASQLEKTEWIAQSETSHEVVAIDNSRPGDAYDTLLDDGEERPPTPATDPGPEDIVAVLYTSGTTGLPKGAAISHRAFLARANVMCELGVVSPDTPDFIAWPPMFHMASTDPLFGVGLVGGTYYTIDGHKTELILQRAREGSHGWLAMMPSTIQPVLDYIAENDVDTAEITARFIGSQADLVAPDKIAEVSEVFDVPFINTFGSTETGLPPATGNAFAPGERPDPAMPKMESPLCDVRLVDEAWNVVPPGEPGEAAMRGPTLFSGYVGNREANETDFNDGWFRGGDVFVRREDGRLEFVDRRKYLIKSGGENIYPAEIEKALMEHSQIVEAIAIRVPDDEWGEVPKAYIATEADADMSGGDVLEFLDGKVARYKFPHYVEFVDQTDFPRSTSGKIQRATVEDWPVRDDERIRNP